MNSSTQPLKGTRDFYPDDMARRAALLQPIQKTVENYGYVPYNAPLLEPLALYAAKSSAEIVERQSYVFDDRGGERLVLRPEMTPSLARLIAAKQRELPSILRWYSFAECWRYERPQKGRLRNFLQLNVDLIGSDTVEADVEVLDLALNTLRSLGIDMRRIELRINDRRLLEYWLTSCQFASENWPEILSVLDAKDKMQATEFKAALERYGSSEQAGRMIEFLSQPVEEITASRDGERLRAVEAELTKIGWKDCVRIDPTIIRGFTYYTGIVFEVYETSGQFRRAIFGGGRYDNLVEAVGGTPVSGIGFGVSDASFEETLKAQEKTLSPLLPERTVVIPFSAAEEPYVQACLNALRSHTLIGERALPPYDLKKQLAFATKRDATWAILIFPDEALQEQVVLKNLKTSTQTTVNIADLAEKIRGIPRAP